MTLKICQIDLSEAELLFQIQAFEQSVRVIKLNKTFCFLSHSNAKRLGIIYFDQKM